MIFTWRCGDTACHILSQLVVALLCWRGHHSIAMEPPLRHYRSQTRSSPWCIRLGGSNDTIWHVAIILDAGGEVRYLTKLRRSVVHLITITHSRFLAGVLNGNIGVMKSMLAEMTDETNMARAFALIPLTWSIGSALGCVSSPLLEWLRNERHVRRPYIGGSLSRPHDHWPDIFNSPFWRQYPYFLPCAAVSAYGLVSVIIASAFLKEVNSKG
jgi:hypothetical protein